MMPELSLKRSIEILVDFRRSVWEYFCWPPAVRHEGRTRRKEGIELAIAIDVSNSMLAEDVSPVAWRPSNHRD